MKKIWKKIGIVLAIALLVVFILLTWYTYVFSMDIAKSYEINNPAYEQKILIATQGSPFKDKVVDYIVDELIRQRIYIKVVDVSELPTISKDQFTAIVVLHTWEMEKPPDVVADFLEKSKNQKNIIVLATSGGSDTTMEGIDAISSASKMIDVPFKAEEILKRLKPILEK